MLTAGAPLDNDDDNDDDDEPCCIEMITICTNTRTLAIRNGTRISIVNC